MSTRFELVPLTLEEANIFIERYHRHHPPVTHGAKFAIGAAEDGVIHGVAIVGTPRSRILNTGWEVEVLRTCTDGTEHVNSFLYGAAWRAAKALGYKRIFTYVLKSETGVSLKAAGWQLVGAAGGGKWDRPHAGRPRADLHPLEEKWLWDAGDREAGRRIRPRITREPPGIPLPLEG